MRKFATALELALLPLLALCASVSLWVDFPSLVASELSFSDKIEAGRVAGSPTSCTSGSFVSGVDKNLAETCTVGGAPTELIVGGADTVNRTATHTVGMLGLSQTGVTRWASVGQPQFPVSGTLSNFRVAIQRSPGTAPNAWTASLYTGTSLPATFRGSCTISTGQTSCTPPIPISVAITAGDHAYIEMVGTSSPLSPRGTGWSAILLPYTPTPTTTSTPVNTYTPTSTTTPTNTP